MSDDTSVMSQSVIDVIKNTDVYLVENIRTARRYISSLKTGRVIEELTFYQVDKKTGIEEVSNFFAEIGEKDVGVISEAGCPGIADPGNVVVRYGNQNNFQVVPLAGPSSIFMALMASGLNGQKFTFHGYLPIDKKPRIARIKELEQKANKSGYSQIFMETPYRNNHLVSDLLSHLSGNTLLCIASDITATSEFIRTQSVSVWKNQIPDLNKRPTIFIINRG